MAIDGPTATIIASLIAATVVFLTVGGAVIYRLGRLEKGSEDLEKAVAKIAVDTQKALAKHAEDTEKALASAAADADRRFEAVTTDIDRRFEAVAVDIDRRFEAMAADMDRRFTAAAVDTNRRFDRLEEIIRTEQDATRAEIRRLAEALATHTHDADGTTVFRIPPVNP